MIILRRCHERADIASDCLAIWGDYEGSDGTKVMRQNFPLNLCKSKLFWHVEPTSRQIVETRRIATLFSSGYRHEGSFTLSPSTCHISFLGIFERYEDAYNLVWAPRLAGV
jgi:hypothetical protein